MIFPPDEPPVRLHEVPLRQKRDVQAKNISIQPPRMATQPEK